MQTASLTKIYLSLILAFILQMLPWSGIGLLIRPEFVLVVVLYWLMRAPHLCNIGTAWFAGLVIDLATGGVFGQNALAYCIAAFFAVSYQRRLALFNPWQQTGYVFVLLVLAQLTVFILKLFSGGESPGWIYFSPSLTGILLWQIVVFSRLSIDGRSNKNPS